MARSLIRVGVSLSNSSQGVFLFENLSFVCALGRGGVSLEKVEGDGVTPVGVSPLREGLYRADRWPDLERRTAFPFQKLVPEDGWCDDRADVQYNQRIKMPFLGHHEDLWREDGVYDVIIPIGYNDDPVVRGRGSAIFLHIARDGCPPTEGCVALLREDFFQLLAHPQFTRETQIQMEG